MNVMLLAIALFSPAFSANAQEVAVDANIAIDQQSVAQIEETPVFEAVEVVSEKPSTIEEQPTVVIDNSKIEDLEGKLTQKEQIIEQLSLHLASALKRLNSYKGVENTPSKISAVLAAKDRASKKAQKLQDECNTLKQQLSVLQKEKQLLDLENRQLFHALNGVQRPGRVASKAVYSKNHNKTKDVVAYPSHY